ncbi:MAG: NYN domain-containing protein [Candidatus Omnitrophica bacterium]|nr:NYN domain-containing protein [Candidatus Omnitrophota bacterium]
MYSCLVLIDGYNLVNKIPDLIRAGRKSIDHARDMLLSMAESYCDYHHAECVIVYDGNHAGRSMEGKNPVVMFSSSGETADTVIESIIYKLGDKQKATVVTDDRQIKNLVTGMGAFTMSVACFNDEAKNCADAIRRRINEKGCF